ncbi:efflux RND transporter periplasmic adaptor subunit [Vibrio sp. B1Z05]|uniref:efflux RND transporter periplasmic adaptor subunit n=1 Tax=Vibrio sp. B1Z05 TaxID=2654980 RepID=UPI00128BE6FA|nr:efflux RND transporter periplasmic adaptor subunit [Vibrio sp. B1Z05]MPW35323.1 efflux RND transporter periplasmic adaptor subunit [Vibrio sp. B1Z05]
MTSCKTWKFKQTYFGKWALASTLLLASFSSYANNANDASHALISPFSCLLEPSSEVELSSEVQGVIKELRVNRGDKVKKGQVVMKLNSTVEIAAVNTVKARLDFASRKVERNADLYRKSLISDNEQDEMLTEQRLAEFQLKEAKVRLSQRQTRSPISGVVIERIKDPGEFVDEEPFLRIATLNPIHAEVVLPAELYGKISKGQKVNLSALGKDATYQGKVSIIDPIIDAASNTFAVTVSLNNDSQSLFVGQRCDVEFISGS